MFYALILTLCSVSPTQSYAIDQCSNYAIQTDTAWNTKRKCTNDREHGLRREHGIIEGAMGDDGSLAEYLAQYGIETPVGLVTDYALSCERFD